MFENTKPFQMIVIGACLFLGVVGVIIFAFAGAKKDPTKDYGPQVTVWGTADEATINSIIADINGNTNTINAKYVQKDADTFNQDLLEAIASGKGPDVALLPVEDILTNRDRISLIPFTSIPERTFKDTFTQEAELLSTHDGLLGLPFSVDPLVMYWNRDIFTAKNIATPPAYWDTLIANVPVLEDVSSNLTVNQSAVSLGDYRNVNHAKEIFEALLFQSGTGVTSLDYNTQEQKDVLSTALGLSNATSTVNPAEASLSFYTQFADPLSKEYTWNRSLPNSLDLFTAGNLAIYFGLGTEVSAIRAKNPNLNFDMALFPEQRSASVPTTYGKMYALVIMSSSNNKVGALNAMTYLSGQEFLKRYSAKTGLPPVRRDLLANVPASDPIAPILYKSALYAKASLDPNPSVTDQIFQTAVEAVLSGASISTDAIKTATTQIGLLVDKFNKR